MGHYLVQVAIYSNRTETGGKWLLLLGSGSGESAFGEPFGLGVCLRLQKLIRRRLFGELPSDLEASTGSKRVRKINAVIISKGDKN